MSFSKAIADYIDYYNNRRIQAKTKWMPPSKFREASMSGMLIIHFSAGVQKTGYISLELPSTFVYCLDMKAPPGAV